MGGFVITQIWWFRADLRKIYKFAYLVQLSASSKLLVLSVVYGVQALILWQATPPSPPLTMLGNLRVLKFQHEQYQMRLRFINIANIVIGGEGGGNLTWEQA